MTIKINASYSDCVRIVRARGVSFRLGDGIITFVDGCTSETVVLFFDKRGRLKEIQKRTFILF